MDGLRRLLTDRLARTLAELEALEQAAAGETRSSAGDKYETGREMIGQARAMQERIRADAQAGLDWVACRNPSIPSEIFAWGALALASGTWYLVCPCPVELHVQGIPIQCVSLASPFGQACKGARQGEIRIFRDRAVEILRIL
ncbi:MAG TPA: hypothetical protein VN931_02160 [Fibrobacteria bacterium]|nr:hypothetical protein [Fibrobacteria bacterium]